MARSTSLPVELWSHVFNFVPYKSLPRLCLVCRLFRAESFRAIHTDIQLNSLAATQRWFDNILRQPHQAMQVKMLSFSILHPSIAQVDIIQQVLPTLTNLQDLEIHSSQMGSAQILSGYPVTFRLRAFRNGALDLRCTIPFISSQPSITLWEQRDATLPAIMHFPHDILPNLKILLCTLCVLENIPALPTITYVKILDSLDGRDQELQAIRLLRRFSRTLQDLSLDRKMTEKSLLLEHLIVQVAKCIPHLSHFTVKNKGKTVSDITASHTGSPLIAYLHIRTRRLKFLTCRKLFRK